MNLVITESLCPLWGHVVEVAGLNQRDQLLNPPPVVAEPASAYKIGQPDGAADFNSPVELVQHILKPVVGQFAIPSRISS